MLFDDVAHSDRWKMPRFVVLPTCYSPATHALSRARIRAGAYDSIARKWWISRTDFAHASSVAQRDARASCDAARARDTRARHACADADEPGHDGRALVCSPEQIRTAVTALRGRRPRPLDDGARCSDCSLRARGGGLEPPMTGPEPVVLPITPPPKGGGQASGRVTSGPKQFQSRRARARAAARARARGRAARSSRTAGAPGARPSTAA